jgi:hypothetical protein
LWKNIALFRRTKLHVDFTYKSIASIIYLLVVCKSVNATYIPGGQQFSEEQKLKEKKERERHNL